MAVVWNVCFPLGMSSSNSALSTMEKMNIPIIIVDGKYAHCVVVACIMELASCVFSLTICLCFTDRPSHAGILESNIF